MAKNNNLKDFVTGVAGAIREKKGTTELINPQDFENEIRTIQTGTDTSDATAVADDIRLGKTAYGADGKMTGTIADYDGTSEPASGKSLLAQRVDGSLTEVSASDLAGATKIRSYAFYHYDVLRSITIPSSVTSIESNAFGYCNSLISVTIPNGVTSIKQNTFLSCSSLTSVTIPNSVTSIGNGAFSNCSSLTSITIPDSVTSIESSAFSRCSSLTSITIPDGVTSIGPYVFYYCNSLTSIKIPNRVTRIGGGAFYGCAGLTSITIGNGVTSIEDNAFSSCGTATESGTTYMILATTPPTIQSRTFSNAKINKIIVPKGTLDAYKSATNWSALADKIEEATE